MTNYNVEDEFEHYFPKGTFGRPIRVQELDHETAFHNICNVFFAIAQRYQAQKADITDVENARDWINANMVGARFEPINDGNWWTLIFD